MSALPLRKTWVRSKVAWRLLFIFFASAVVPAAVVVGVGYQQLTHALRHDGEKRLEKASKAIGLDLLARLSEVELELARAEPQMISNRRPLPRAILNDLSVYFSALTFRSDERAMTLLGDDRVPKPELHAGESEHIASGKTLITTRFGEAGESQVLLLRRGEQGGTWTGVVRGAFVVPNLDEEALPFATDYCVFDAKARPIGCTRESLPPLGLDGIRTVSDSVSGTFRWEGPSQSYLASHWSLFLKPNYYESDWTVVLVIPESQLFGPLNAFRESFPLISAALIAFAVLLGLTQIRRQLVPLERLRDGTRKLASGDFDYRFEVTSGDDFEELAESFNQMTLQLRSQFSSLQRMVEIDRAILSQTSAERIIEVTLSHIAELYPCDAALALLATTDTARVFFRENEKRTIREDFRGVALESLRAAFPEDGFLPMDVEAVPSVLSSALAPHKDLAWIAIPLTVDEEIVAAVLLGGREAATKDQRLFAEQIANQSAVALGKARIHEKNKALAYFDSLTGLPNRLLYRERLSRALLRARRTRGATVAMTLDLDQFKRINDTLGHEAGDQLLQRVAARLERTLGHHTVARMGGDEFMVLIEESQGSAEAARLVAAITEAVNRPHDLGGHEVIVTASVGIAVAPNDGDDLETLLRNADAALYHAKDAGRNCSKFYAASMNAAAAKRLETESGLRKALQNDEFEVFFQPILNTADLTLSGMEALVRWRLPGGDLVPPYEFIPLAESMGLIEEIGHRVLNLACAEAAAYQRRTQAPLRLSVNVSPRQLRDRNFSAQVFQALEVSGLHGSTLTLEITEHVLAETDPETLRSIEVLTSAGIETAIDDFGTGYSSMAYLKQFPVNSLKIDRSFTKNVATNPEDRAITESVIAICRGLGLRSVAEGVENEAQLQVLRELGCDLVQGFLFSPPLPGSEFEKWLDEHEPELPQPMLR